ncbi:MAG: hypothetical protein PHU23_07745 [Dehalococcoidales bacterium]|nr:hypothetical protein [Dehalococcoidales bacterium]
MFKETERVWFAEIEKRTGGRVKIEAHYNGELFGLFDIYDAILKGTVDMAKILPTMYSDKFPMDGIMIFTPVNVNVHRSGAAWLELYNTFPVIQSQYQNTPLLGLAPTPCHGLCTTKKEIHKWEDAKGLKMPGTGPAPESRLTAVGIVPTSIPPSDTYVAFKTGTPGRLKADADCRSFNLQSVLPYWKAVLSHPGREA